MKKTISFHEFQRDFQDVRPDNFSYDGLKALFDYLEDLSDDCGTEIELDVIAICCEFSEYDSAMEAAREHGNDYYPLLYDDDDNEREEEEVEEEADAYFIEWLQERTQVIPFDGGVIIQDY